jgi:hypothetical protein
LTIKIFKQIKSFEFYDSRMFRRLKPTLHALLTLL